MSRILISLLAMCAALGAKPLLAQVLRGTVVDSATRSAVTQGSVALLSLEREVVEVIQVDSFGRFQLQAPRTGVYLLYSQLLGYVETVSSPLELLVGQPVEVELEVVPDPFILDTLSVAVEAQQHRLRLVGFYDRRERESGLFIEEDEIARLNPVETTDLFRRRRGAALRTQNVRGIVRNRVFFRQGCVPAIFLDGLLVRRGGGSEFLNDLVFVADIAGIEAYRSPSEVPVQYSGTGATCGVILVWTK